MKLESLKSGKFFEAQLTPEKQRTIRGGGTYTLTKYTASNGTSGSDKTGTFCTGNNYDYGTKYDSGSTTITQTSTSPLPGTRAGDY